MRDGVPGMIWQEGSPVELTWARFKSLPDYSAGIPWPLEPGTEFLIIGSRHSQWLLCRYVGFEEGHSVVVRSPVRSVGP